MKIVIGGQMGKEEIKDLIVTTLGAECEVAIREMCIRDRGPCRAAGH